MKLKIQVCLTALLALLCFGLAAHGAALTEERSTAQRDGKVFALTVASNVVIYKGGIVSRDSEGNAIPASDTASTVVIGRAPSTVDNRAAAYHASRTIAVENGVFGWAHTGFTDADIGQLAYVMDDQTVTLATNATYDIVAGVIVDVDGTTCWVDTGNIPRQGAQSVASLAVSGAATIGTTLGVSGNATFSGTTVAITNNGTVAGTFGVTGTTTLGALTTTGTTSLGGTTVAVTNNATVAGTLGVTGAASFTSTVAGSGFKIGAISGFTGVVTNGIGTAVTNYTAYSGGIVTNNIITALPE